MNLLEKYKALAQEVKKLPPSVVVYNANLFKKDIPPSRTNPAPTANTQPRVNVKTTWPPEIQAIVNWFMDLAPPAESFYLEPHIRVINPVKFFATLRRKIEAGPSGPRARMGALQSDLRALQVKFHKEGH